MTTESTLAAHFARRRPGFRLDACARDADTAALLARRLRHWSEAECNADLSARQQTGRRLASAKLSAILQQYGMDHGAPYGLVRYAWDAAEAAKDSPRPDLGIVLT